MTPSEEPQPAVLAGARMRDGLVLRILQVGTRYQLRLGDRVLVTSGRVADVERQFDQMTEGLG